ncbi:hypothetical protein [Pseudomonas sp. LT1P18]|uniref:hypothetical protein n=1 Tax=Pseudomonas arabinosi TaxID=3398357 RepID=UPI0039F0D650
MYAVPEPLADETLSSWMWRVNSTAHIPIMSYMRFSSLEGEIIERDKIGLRGERFADRDLLTENGFIETFKKEFNISQPWLNKRFPEFSQPTIPTQFRRAFCSQCFIESFQKIGIPVSKVQWCYLTKPLCEFHGTPLHDSSIFFIDHDDYTIQAFVSYWDDHQFKEDCDLIRGAGAMRNSLALKAQQQLDKLTKRASKSGHSFGVQMFVLTLMRSMMIPAFHHGYPKIAFAHWGGSDPYAGLGIHGDFYNEIYRSTCLARLYALYFSAIILGWITSEQAFKTLREGYFSPWNTHMIWSILDDRPGILRLLFSELKLYETPCLNLTHMNIPKLTRIIYDV